MKEKQDLEDDAQACRQKMANATALIDGLGGEKVGLPPSIISDLPNLSTIQSPSSCCVSGPLD